MGCVMFPCQCTLWVWQTRIIICQKKIFPMKFNFQKSIFKSNLRNFSLEKQPHWSGVWPTKYGFSSSCSCSPPHVCVCMWNLASEHHNKILFQCKRCVNKGLECKRVTAEPVTVNKCRLLWWFSPTRQKCR